MDTDKLINFYKFLFKYNITREKGESDLSSYAIIIIILRTIIRKLLNFDEFVPLKNPWELKALQSEIWCLMILHQKFGGRCYPKPFPTFFFLIVEYDIQVGSTSDEMTSFNQPYLINPLVTLNRTRNMANKITKGNICVRETYYRGLAQPPWSIPYFQS